MFPWMALTVALGPGVPVRAGPPAAGQPDAAREIAARAAARGVPEAGLVAPVAEAARRGLPADLVAEKVLEGLAKGVPPERVAAVARGLVERLGVADDLLVEARGRGLAPPADRRGALADLAAALAQGVPRPAVAELVGAAQAARGKSDAVVAAAHALAELSRRGVSPADSLPLGKALAAREPRPAGEIPALLDAWRAEGGKDSRAFLDEAARRVSAGRSLDGMVDHFGETPDRLVRDPGATLDKEKGQGRGAIDSDVGRKGGDMGLGPGERNDSARGAVPGLDDAARDRSRMRR